MTATIRIAACDLNGQPRGKRLPESYLGKLDEGAARMPLSALVVDVAGADIEASPLLFETGDADGTLLPTGRGPVPMPWLATPSQLVPMWMFRDRDTPFGGDPRQALAAVLARYAARGLTVMAATELEFYLVEDAAEGPRLPVPPGRSRPLAGEAILSLDTLDAFDAFFTDLYEGAEAMGIPAQAAISESGVGQFEVNLTHVEAMRAADDCWLFKLLVRGTARKHGLAATFMAKPFPDQPGNGLHLHFSVLDGSGRNVFDDGSPRGSDLLRQAVAGCLGAMEASTLIFAPHGVSFDRFVPGAHAPTAACWGYENRTTALRIPGGPSQARRIEHRVAGADTCPYLVVATILGAALTGIEDAATPPPPVDGNAYANALPGLAPDWTAARCALQDSEIMARIFPGNLIKHLIRTKEQEQALYGGFDRAAAMRLYLDTV